MITVKIFKDNKLVVTRNAADVSKMFPQDTKNATYLLDDGSHLKVSKRKTIERLAAHILKIFAI